MPRCVVALRSRFQNGMFVAWHGRGMACVNQTLSHCVNEMGKTQSKLLAARHGRGTAWYVRISLKTFATIHNGFCLLVHKTQMPGCCDEQRSVVSQQRRLCLRE
jgi:hypothetical protein